MTTSGYDRAVWSWTEHLRHGGTRKWSSWTGSEEAVGVPPARWTPSGAAQLELVRRLAAPGLLTGTAFTELADLVLGRSGPGRGLAQQPLVWPGKPTGATERVGPPPVDPADVPLEELVRLGVGALTELVLRARTLPAAPDRVRRRLLRGGPAFALAGAPVTTSAVRRALGAAGHREGGRSPLVLVFAEPLDHAMAQVWSARVQRGAPVRWRGFVERWAGRPGLPAAADPSTLARTWAERVGSGRVHVVVAPAGLDAATRTARDLLGVHTAPPGAGGSPVAGCQDLGPAAVDVARRVNGVLNVRAGADRRPAAQRTLVDVLDAVEPGGHRLGLPVGALDWAGERAAGLADDLTRGGYPVHGRLAGLAPVVAGLLPTRPRPGAVLGVVVAACLRQAALGAAADGVGTPGERTEAR